MSKTCTHSFHVIRYEEFTTLDLFDSLYRLDVSDISSYDAEHPALGKEFEKLNKLEKCLNCGIEQPTSRS
jgi:hypothetical protein